MTKIGGLTRLNVRALREVFPQMVNDGVLVLTATTATFHGFRAEEVLKILEYVMGTLPTAGHPRASLHAVRRKLVKEAMK